MSNASRPAVSPSRPCWASGGPRDGDPRVGIARLTERSLMAGFIKLDSGILASTVWVDLPARNVFLTALLMAEPYELAEPTAQLQVDALESTGWTVPAGWY